MEGVGEFWNFFFSAFPPLSPGNSMKLLSKEKFPRGLQLIPFRQIFKNDRRAERRGDEVFQRPIAILGALKIRFANDLVGYAYDGTTIYMTTNGGESWSGFADNKFVSSFAITSDEVTCASFSSGSISVTTPSTIVRAENGDTWKPVITFPYTILSQGFSPDGNLGIAIGISGSNPSIDPASQIMTISLSIDEGETWVDLTEQLDGFPLEISVPSANVAYILCSDKIIRYSP